MDIIDFSLGICKSIYKLAENVKSNKERCQRVAQRVKGLEELVNTIKQRGPGQISATVENALKELRTTLESAKQLMVKYSQTKPVMNFLKSGSREDQFSQINEKLTDTFQILSGALQIEHGNVLFKVFQTVAGRSMDEEYGEQASYASPTAPMAESTYSDPSTYSDLSTYSAPSPYPAPSSYSDPSTYSASMTASSPTAPMPPMPMSSPTSPMPYPSMMPPMPVSAPPGPMPVRCIMSPMQMSHPRAVMALTGTMNPALYSTNIASNHVYATVSPTVISSSMGPRPVIRAVAPMRAPVVRTYINNPYYR